jgi:phage terminase small subunit
MKATKPKAPGHLQPATRRWFEQVLADFDLEPHHLHLLVLAGEALDRCEQARAVLQREGMTYVDRFGAPRARPEVAVERDSRIGFARLLRELALDANAPQDPRPPGISTMRKG